MRQRLGWVGVIAVGVLAGGFGCSSQPRADSRPASHLDDLGTVEDFAFVNQEGKTVTRADLKGKVWVADFIFTRCAGPCPRISGTMAHLQHDLAGREDVRLVSFTVDPDHDTPAVLKEYAARFGADPARWYFLTGAKDKVYNLILHSFMLFVEANKEQAPGRQVTHDTRLALVDGRGHIRAYFDGTSEEDLKKLEQAIEELTREQS